MQQFSINWVAVVAAAVVRFLVSWLWYSPLAFHDRWLEYSGCSLDDLRASGRRALLADLFVGIPIALVLLHLIHETAARTWGHGVAVAAIFWVGFVAVDLPQQVWEKRSGRLFLLHNIGRLLCLGMMGAMLAAWP